MKLKLLENRCIKVTKTLIDIWHNDEIDGTVFYVLHTVGVEYIVSIIKFQLVVSIDSYVQHIHNYLSLVVYMLLLPFND